MDGGRGRRILGSVVFPAPLARPDAARNADRVRPMYRGSVLGPYSIETRHRVEPPARYNLDERRHLCLICGVPGIPRQTHRRVQLHQRRAAIQAAADEAFQGTFSGADMDMAIMEVYRLRRQARLYLLRCPVGTEDEVVIVIGDFEDELPV